MPWRATARRWRFEAFCGDEDAEVVSILSNLGSTQQQLSDLSGAKAVLERALAIEERIHGGEHPSTAVRLNNLACVHVEFGDVVGARDCLERALAIQELAYGREICSWRRCW